MVYCGKPSKACWECRVRRTKCDTVRPTCSQCVRARRTCTGYRDGADLLFRNQTAETRANNSGSKQVETSRNAPLRLKVENVSANGSMKRPNPTIKDTSFCNKQLDFRLFSPTISTSLEEQAICYFFKNYVMDGSASLKGNFSYLLDVYNREVVSVAMNDAIVSLGTVGLAHFYKTPRISINANLKYYSAVNTVSQQLRGLESAKEDQTLITVLLLGLYETNTYSSPRSMESWAKHISGATALLQIRGRQQLQSVVGHDLFVQIRGQVITNCLQRRTAVPSNVDELSDIALQYENEEEVAATMLSKISIRFCKLRSTMTHFSDFSNSEGIVAGAIEVDTELAAWVATCPLQYLYSTSTLKQRSDDVFSDSYHVYSSIWIATIWNHYRSVRILVNELIIHHLKHLSEEESELTESGYAQSLFYQTQILSSTSVLLQLTHDICSSVPFFLSFNMDQSKVGDSPKAISGNLLLWPLYVASSTKFVSQMMREWVARRLIVIAETMGIRQGMPMAHYIQAKTSVQLWELEYVDPLVDPQLAHSDVDTNILV